MGLRKRTVHHGLSIHGHEVVWATSETWILAGFVFRAQAQIHLLHQRCDSFQVRLQRSQQPLQRAGGTLGFVTSERAGTTRSRRRTRRSYAAADATHAGPRQACVNCISCAFNGPTDAPGPS